MGFEEGRINPYITKLPLCSGYGVVVFFCCFVWVFFFFSLSFAPALIVALGPHKSINLHSLEILQLQDLWAGCGV